MIPRRDDLLLIDRRASVQFALSPFLFRVIGVKVSYHSGWLWLDGEQLNAKRQVVEQRSIFVQAAGLVLHQPAATGR